MVAPSIEICRHALKKCGDKLFHVQVCTFQYRHVFVATTLPMPRMSHTCDTHGLFKLWMICTVVGDL